MWTGLWNSLLSLSFNQVFMKMGTRILHRQTDLKLSVLTPEDGKFFEKMCWKTVVGVPGGIGDR